MLLSRPALIRLLGQIIDRNLEKRGLAGNGKGIIPAAYGGSGNPAIQRANESATSLGSKLHKLVAPWSNRNGLKPTASQSVKYSWDADGNKVIDGPIVDASAVVVDADYIMGLRPVAPGNTLLLSANTERSTTSASYVDVKRFFVTRPGRYRIKGELARSGSTTRAVVVVELSDGTKLTASSEATQSTLTYPTYGSQFTLDMTQPVAWGMFIVVRLLNDSGPSQTGYIKNVTVNYADASASLTPYDATITD